MKKNYLSANRNLIKEWNWDKNNPLNLYPNEITCGCSRQKVWWKCSSCSYEWRATPNNRSRGTGCPLCSNKIVIEGKNDLGTVYPEIAERWHPTLNKLKPSQVTAHSNKKVYWVCKKNKNHYFSTRIDHMVDANIDCPVCSNQKILFGVNDLASTNPELMLEWDFEKNDTKPEKYTQGNSKKVWWKCSNGHSWLASIYSRTAQKCGCPICSRELRVSFAEDVIGYYLSNHFKIEKSKHFIWLNKKELDIYLPELFLAIEYDGERWHKNWNRDFQKDILCDKNGIKLIRIREPNCPKYETTAKLLHLTKKNDFGSLHTAIRNIFDYISDSFGLNVKTDIDIQRDYDEILKLHIVREKECSITDADLLAEWDYKKNFPLLPSMFKKGSHRKVWWKCSLGHEWQAVISSRTGLVKCGCPYCSGKKIVIGWNDFQTLYPNISKEWDFERNSPILPSQVRPKTNKKYWWKCEKCRNIWCASIASRTNGRGCPKCGREKTTQAKLRKVLNLDTNEQYTSAIVAGAHLGINPGSIRNCCNGRTKTAGGFHWRYIKD